MARTIRLTRLNPISYGFELTTRQTNEVDSRGFEWLSDRGDGWETGAFTWVCFYIFESGRSRRAHLRSVHNLRGGITAVRDRRCMRRSMHSVTEFTRCVALSVFIAL